MTEITQISDKIYLVYIRYIPQNNFCHSLVLRRKMKCIMEMDKLLYVPPQYNLFHNKKIASSYMTQVGLEHCSSP